MTDDRIDELTKKIENLPDQPPVVVKANVWVALIRTFFEAVAIIGIVFTLVGINDARIEACEADNEFRLEVAGVLFDSQRPNASPEEKAFLEMEINRFSLVDCGTPSNPKTQITRDMVTSIPRPTTTTTSTTTPTP